MDNLKRFNQFSREFYFEIINRHPEWDKYAFVDFQGDEPLITIEIPAPIPGVPPIEIIAESDDDEEITIYFGMAHYHMGIYLRYRERTLINQLDGIDEITEMIFNEELIAVQQNPGSFFVHEGIVTLHQYKRLIRIWPEPRRCLRWRTSTWSGADCCQRGRHASCDRPQRGGTPAAAVPCRRGRAIAA